MELLDALLPPAWQANGQPTYLLGTDSQGRDLYSAILYGTRVSLLIGLAAVALSMVIGIVLGLVSATRAGASTPSSCAWPTCSCRSRPS